MDDNVTPTRAGSTKARAGNGNGRGGPLVLPWVWLWREVLECAALRRCAHSYQLVYLYSWTVLDRRTGELLAPDGTTVAEELAVRLRFRVGLVERALEKLRSRGLVQVEGQVYRVPDLLRFSPLPSRRGGRPRVAEEELSVSGAKSRRCREQKRHEGTQTDANRRKPDANRTQTDANLPPLKALRFSESVVRKSEKNAEILSPSPPPGAVRASDANLDANRTQTGRKPPEGLQPEATTYGVSKVLEVLEADAGGAISTRCDDRARERFARIVEELRDGGTTLEDWRSLARWARTGGFRWRTQGPPGIGYLSRPGIAARHLDEAKSAKTERSGANRGSDSESPAERLKAGLRAQGKPALRVVPALVFKPS